ncbi:unnamed protein product [Nesidiocoris tenuis]|uniref:Uncharacterized protein n=1 Tax=Nesidiocoris tenuis TaxID=355587 RepID=A0A6H5GCT4_9HEMI|nr:unnamed protein product [Nesidiocoris tenuis]
MEEYDHETIVITSWFRGQLIDIPCTASRTDWFLLRYPFDPPPRRRGLIRRAGRAGRRTPHQIGRRHIRLMCQGPPAFPSPRARRSMRANQISSRMPLRPASPRPDKEGSPRILYRREGGEERRGSPGWNPRTPRAIGGLPLGGPSITDTRTRDPLAPPVSTLRRKVSFMKMVLQKRKPVRGSDGIKLRRSVEGRSRDRPEIKPCSRGRRKGEIFTGESYAPLQGPETHEVKEQGRGVAAVVVALTKASRHWRTGRCYLGAPYSDPADLRNRLEMNGHRVHEAGGTKCSTRKLCAMHRYKRPARRRFPGPSPAFRLT